MADPFIGEIRLVGYSFAPEGWLFCQGQQVPIAGNEVLFSLIGTTYGGDGVSTFALPNLSSRAPIHTGTSASSGTNYPLALLGGQENVTLTVNQLPSHTHSVAAQSASAVSSSPSGALLGSNLEYLPAPGAQATGALLSAAGGSQPHSNLMPYQAMNYIIATEGLYPSP